MVCSQWTTGDSSADSRDFVRIAIYCFASEFAAVEIYCAVGEMGESRVAAEADGVEVGYE